MPPDETTRWILIAAAGAVAFYLIVLRPKRQRANRSAASDGPARLSHQRTVEREMSTLLVDLTEMSRQVGAQLDTRAARLEVLIQQADARIAELRRLSGAGDVSAPNNREPASPPRELFLHDPLPPTPPTVNNANAEVHALADQGLSPQEIAARLGRPSGEIELILALRVGA